MSSRRNDSRSRHDRSRERKKSSSPKRGNSKLIIDTKNKWTDKSASRFSVAPSDYDKSQNYPTKPTAIYGMNSSVNPNILYTLNDNTKIKRKIFIPKVSGVNFVGLLIGPRGTYQKRLEQQSGCKILIRGK
jgi:hypothetical protein